MGVLMNVNDQFAYDSYPDNNLDLTYMNLESQKVIRLQDEVWMSVNNDQSTSVSASINDRGDQHEWSYAIENQPAWLKVTESTNLYSYNLQFDVEALNVPVGMNQITVKLTAKKDGQTFESSTLLYIFKNSGPVLNVVGLPADNLIRLDSPNVSVTEENGVKTLHYQITVQNAGTEPLYYSPKRDTASLQIEAPGPTVIAPGQSQTLKLSMTLVGIPIPRDNDSTRTYFGLELNSNGGNRYVEIYLELGALGTDNGPVNPINPVE